MTQNVGFSPLLILFVVLMVGCATSPATEDTSAQCLGEPDIVELQAKYLEAPEATEQEYVGKQLCVDGVVAHVQQQLGSISVAVNIADQVGAMLLYDEARVPEEYARATEWAEGKAEGDSIRLSCTLGAFVMVEGAPEPMAIVTFQPCSLAK